MVYYISIKIHPHHGLIHLCRTNKPLIHPPSSIHSPWAIQSIVAGMDFYPAFPTKSNPGAHQTRPIRTGVFRLCADLRGHGENRFGPEKGTRQGRPTRRGHSGVSKNRIRPKMPLVPEAEYALLACWPHRILVISWSACLASSLGTSGLPSPFGRWPVLSVLLVRDPSSLSLASFFPLPGKNHPFDGLVFKANKHFLYLECTTVPPACHPIPDTSILSWFYVVEIRTLRHHRFLTRNSIRQTCRAHR